MSPSYIGGDITNFLRRGDFCRQVKGKQVKDLCDLVTVRLEQENQKVTDFFISLEFGKTVFCVGNDLIDSVPRTVEPGNLPDAGTGKFFQITRN